MNYGLTIGVRTNTKLDPKGYALEMDDVYVDNWVYD